MGCRPNARERAKPFVQATIEHTQLRVLVAGLARIEAKCEQVLRVETHIDRMEVGEGANEQSGA